METTSDKYTKESLLKIINALPLAICVVDSDIMVILANEAMTRFTNQKNEQLMGRACGDALGCANRKDSPQGCGFGPNCIRCRLRKILTKTLETKEPLSMVETTMALKNHGKCHLRISTLPLVLNHKDATLLSIEDMTEIEQNEKNRIEKEKISAAVETAGAVCHEINQPLMVIMGMAEILLEDISPESPSYAHLLEIKTNADRLGGITKKLMTLTEYRTKPYLKKTILDIEESSDKDHS